MQARSSLHRPLKLYYFRAKGAADKVRLLLEEVGMNYQDVQVRSLVDIAHLNCRLDSLPVLVDPVQEMVIPYAPCILRHIAEEARAFFPHTLPRDFLGPLTKFRIFRIVWIRWGWETQNRYLAGEIFRDREVHLELSSQPSCRHRRCETCAGKEEYVSKKFVCFLSSPLFSRISFSGPEFVSTKLEPWLLEVENDMTSNESVYLVNKVCSIEFPDLLLLFASVSDPTLVCFNVLQLSVADICFFSVVDAIIREFGVEPLHNHRLIKYHHETIGSRPRIQQYIQSPRRPWFLLI